MASTYLTPGGAGANLLITKFKRTILPALYNASLFTAKTEEEPDQIFNQLTLRKLGTVTAQQLATTQDGTTFDFQNLAPVTIAVTPTWVLSAAAWPDTEEWRGGDEIKPAAAQNLTDSLAAGVDQLGLSVITVAANVYAGSGVGYDIDATGLRFVLAAIAKSSAMNAAPGDEIFMILDTLQIAPSLAIPEITAAWQRGDGTSPTVTGRVAKGYGFQFDFTTLCSATADGKHGAVFTRRAVHHGWNKKPDVEKQRFMKQNRVMADADVGFKICYDEMLWAIRTRPA